MNVRIRARLIRLARLNRGITSYQNLINQAELGLNLDNSYEKERLDEILEEIGTEEFSKGRPLLNALVKVKGNNGQGDRFFKLCERLGYGSWRELKKDIGFLVNLRQECRDYWMNDQNFETHR
ncbi:hypothetical protein BH24BAC1_BH24BAC1_11180 [soil metagenome]|jgi:hypothetical protein